jgi:hypothetical protein
MQMLSRILPGGLIALALFLAPARSDATEVRLTLGADYQLETTPFFHVTGAVDFVQLGPFAIGGRFGVLLATQSNTLGIPLDLSLRLTPRRTPLYLEALVGPWLFLGGDTFRGHGAFGFGFQGRSVSLGLEVGWLEPRPHVGVRLGWRF